MLTDDEYRKLVNTYGEDKAKAYIKYLDEYMDYKNYKVKSHYLAIGKWVVKAVEEQNKKQGLRKQPAGTSYIDSELVQ